MKKLLLCSLLLVSVVSVGARPARRRARTARRTAPIVWRTDFDAAMKEARRSRKPLFVDFYTDWCQPCRLLDTTTYFNPRFVRASRQWVMVKVNTEKNSRNVQLAQHYNPEGFIPMILMMNARGKQLNSVLGYNSASSLLSEMRKAQGKMGVLSAQLALVRRAG